MSSHAPGGKDRAIGWALAGLVAVHGLWLLFRWGGPRATDVASDLFQVVILGGAAAWAWRSTRQAGESRLAWSLLAAGMTTWAFATAYWSYWEIFKGMLLPVPSAADVGWLLYTALATAAFLVAALRRRSPTQVAVAALDTVLTAVGLFLVVWILLLEDVWAAATGSTVVLVVTLAYPLGDVAVVTAALGYAFRLQSEDRRQVWALPVGATLVALGNLNLSWSYLHAGFQSGSVSDVLWTGGLALVGYGVHCATRTKLRPVPSFATQFEQGLPYLVGAAALGVVTWHYIRAGALEELDQAVALVWISLFLARQFLFLRHAVDVQRRLEQAQALAGLGSWEVVGQRIRLSPMADALLAGRPSPN
ncbi:MAG TPA: hypothetical protein VJ874_01500, partial [Candidatus Thermoplasmatota archaeon]|nr:hypothetical protein [Candidatus Thermoplasmatota archaeon]